MKPAVCKIQVHFSTACLLMVGNIIGKTNNGRKVLLHRLRCCEVVGVVN